MHESRVIQAFIDMYPLHEPKDLAVTSLCRQLCGCSDCLKDVPLWIRERKQGR